MVDEPEDTLGEMFWALARRMRHASAKALTPWEITPSQARAIALVAAHGEIRPGELADHLRIAPRSVTEVLDGLEDKGLVRRTDDPHDRRATLVRLTATGEATAAAVTAARAAEAEAIFDPLGTADREHLSRILAILGAQVDRPGTGSPQVR